MSGTGSGTQVTSTKKSQLIKKENPAVVWGCGIPFIEEPDGKLLSDILFVNYQEENGDQEIAQAIQDLVNSSEQLNNRRQSVNTFFLTSNTLLLGGIGWMCANIPPIGLLHPIVGLSGILLVALLGTLFGIVWIRFIGSYWCVSCAKIVLLNALEEKRKVRIFTAQSVLMKANRYVGTTLHEASIAWIFLVIHILVFIATCIVLVSNAYGVIQLPLPKANP